MFVIFNCKSNLNNLVRRLINLLNFAFRRSPDRYEQIPKATVHSDHENDVTARERFNLANYVAACVMIIVSCRFKSVDCISSLSLATICIIIVARLRSSLQIKHGKSIPYKNRSMVYPLN